MSRWTHAQIHRLYENSPEIHGDVTSRTGFARVVRLVEDARNDAIGTLLAELQEVLEWATKERTPLREQEIASIRAAIAKASGEKK